MTKCSAENLSVTALANNQLSGYGYDAAGNMTLNVAGPLAPQSFTYDAENRITGAGGYTYTYDADGNRVEKSNGSTGTIYWYMTPGIVAESDLSGNLKSEYVFFDGERVARKDFSGSTTSVSYYFSDHLKTASVITNSAGTITEDEDYYPWGGEIPFVNNDSNHYKFTGKGRDAETGLDYFGARYYGNWTGRFLSADWAAKPEAVPYSDLHDPQSLNLYSYVRNIPTSKADADGHCCDVFSLQTWAKVAGAASDVVTGLGKGAANFLIKWDNGNRDMLNKIGGHYEHIQELKPSNKVQEKVMGAGEAAAALALTRGRTETEPAVGKEPAGGGRYSGRYADGQKAYRTNVPRDANNNPEPVPEAEGAHSRLQRDAKDPNRVYSATEFDENGQAVKRTDFAGRQGQPVPHTQDYNPDTQGFSKTKSPVDQH